MITYVYPEIGRALVARSARRGVEVALPPENHCCGVPMLMHGDSDTARELAQALVRDARGSLDGEAVLTACPTCGSALKHFIPKLLADDPGWGPRARALAARALDATEYLAERVDLPAASAPAGPRVTYHDPCHLARGQGVRAQPRELITRVAGHELVELASAEVCCGGAGSFLLTHPALSEQDRRPQGGGDRRHGRRRRRHQLPRLPHAAHRQPAPARPSASACATPWSWSPRRWPARGARGPEPARRRPPQRRPPPSDPDPTRPRPSGGDTMFDWRAEWQERFGRTEPKIICVGLNYKDHAVEGGVKNLPTSPILFAKFATALCNDGDPILMPEGIGHVDSEAELDGHHRPRVPQGVGRRRPGLPSTATPAATT